MEKGKTKFLVFTSIAHFLNDGTLLLFSLLIVYYSEFYHVNIAFLGTMAASYGLLSGLVSPLISHFADRRDIDVPLITFGLALEGISAAFFGLAFAFTSEIYIFILIGAILLGFAQAFYHPLGSAILSYTFGKNSPTALGINGSLGSIGRSVMPSIITLLIIAFGESTGMFFEALIMLIGSLIVYLGLSQFRRLTYEGGESGTVKVKEKLDPKYVKFLFMLGTIIFIRSMFISGTTTFLGEYIYKIYDSKTLVGLFLTLSFIGAVFGQPFFGWLTTKKGGRYTVFLTTIVSTAIFFVFLLWNNFIFSVSMYFLETFFALSGFPVLLGYVTQIFPPRYTATASAYIWGISNMIGGAAGVEVMTLLIGTGIGIQIDFWIILLFGVASSVMLPLIPKKI
ncbi:MAG: MFS transporter [Mesoaciditoga sp.]|uniref:MFS transporter n=1 Tax=Athalassotoga sp. TaxID=2022597 RepID=UPI000CB707D6|nr:MAG: MFS transporter [Mesoaciditoga sp.]PMP80290.1 MAG: MFS transporter [Mesoaciditoga sp.]HEU23632.1 MFS transporter [Mesoaciditoga lauensis]